MTETRPYGAAILASALVAVFVCGSVAALMQTATLMMPRSPGVWTMRSAPRLDSCAILPPRCQMPTEDFEPEVPQVRIAPIWNQYRSGDAFVAVLLSIVVPWFVVHCISKSPMRLLAEVELMLFGY